MNDRVIKKRQLNVVCTMMFVLTLCFINLSFAGPKVLFIFGEDEYEQEASLRDLAAGSLAEAGFEATFINAGLDDEKWNKPQRNEFPGLIEALKTADVLVVATWRRQPKVEVVEALKEWVSAGKPVMGVRTASHAFSKRTKWKLPKGHTSWEEFDREVFGADYDGHYPNLKNRDDQTLLYPLDEVKKSVLFKGVPFKKPEGADTSLYKMKDLDGDTKVLIKGIAAGTPSTEQAVFWTYEKGKTRSVFSTLGASEDFKKLAWLDPLFVNAIRWLAESPAK